MLEIHGQQHGPRGADLLHHQPAGRDQAFLVGQRHNGTPAYGRQGGPEAGGPDDGRHHPIGGPRGRLDHGRRTRRRLDPVPASAALRAA